MGKTIGGIIAAAIVFFVASLTLGSWYTVNERERALFLVNGKLTSIEQPGLGFKWPFFNSIVKVSLETQLVSLDKLHTYSRDQQPAVLRVSIIYRADPANLDDLYMQFGSLQGFEDRTLKPKAYEEIKTVFGRFNAVTAVQERGRLNSEVREAVIRAAKGPAVIENVQIENMDFSAEYEKSIEARMFAEVEVQRIRQNAEREKVNAEIKVIQANATAAATVAGAEAEATAIKLKGNAEAEAITARAKALGQNPNLVTLVQAERWNGVLPTTVLPSSAIPLINTAPR